MNNKDTLIAIGDFACHIGLDWSDTSHVISLRVRGARTVALDHQRST